MVECQPTEKALGSVLAPTPCKLGVMPVIQVQRGRGRRDQKAILGYTEFEANLRPCLKKPTRNLGPMTSDSVKRSITACCTLHIK